MLGQPGDAKFQQPRLPGTEDFARSAQFEVALRDVKPVRALAQRLQALPAVGTQWCLVQQHAMAGRAASTHPAAQLVQLRQAQPFGVFNDHQAGVGHIHPHFDNGGGDQQGNGAGLERAHNRILVGRFHAAVNQADRQVWQGQLQFLRGGLRRLGLQGVALLDQGAHPVGLAPLAAGGRHPCHHLVPAVVVDEDGADGLAPGR